MTLRFSCRSLAKEEYTNHRANSLKLNNNTNNPIDAEEIAMHRSMDELHSSRNRPAKEKRSKKPPEGTSISLISNERFRICFLNWLNRLEMSIRTD